VLAPAVRTAGLEPYRTDRDPSCTIPIEEIEANIRSATVCLADITCDNPNIWYELGYAAALSKPMVLICAGERTDFPFDVRHRSIISYKAESPRDFKDLEVNIARRLRAQLGKAQNLQHIASLSMEKPTEGLTPHEIAALSVIMQANIAPGFGSSPQEVCGDVERTGFTRTAAGLSMRSLRQKKLISIEKDDFHGHPICCVTDEGFEWLQRNQDKLKLRWRWSEPEADVSDEGIPF
jgi:hypothetical protein